MKTVGFILIGLGVALDRLSLIAIGAAVLYWNQTAAPAAAANATTTVSTGGAVIPHWLGSPIHFLPRTTAAVTNVFGGAG